MAQEDILDRARAAVIAARRAVLVEHEHATGMELAQAALDLSQQAHWNEGVGRSHTYIGVCEKFAGDYEAAFRSHTEALEAYGPGAPPKLLSAAKNNLAQVCLMQLDFAAAIRFYEEAIKLAEQSEDQKFLSSIYLNLSNLYYTAGEFEPGFRAVQQALGAMEEGAIDAEHTLIFFILAQLYFTKGDIDAALHQIELLFDQLRRLPDKKRECEAWILKSAILPELQKWEEGLIAAEHGLRLAREMSSPWHEAQALKNGGLFIEMLGRPKEAQVRYERAAEQFNALNCFDMEAAALRASGELLVSQGSESGIATLIRSLEAAERSKAKREIANSHKSLFKAFKQTVQTKLALYHHEKFYEVELNRRNEDSERQLSVLKAREAAEHQRIETMKNKTYAEQLERNLASSTLTLLAQTELLSNFRDDLRAIVRRIPPTEPAIRELKEKLKELPCTSVDWPKFEAQFASVHPNFKTQLMEQYPQLSPAEVRICILIRLKLKSHEIAKLTCLSERSIEDHRYQIRKKLGALKGENVIDYLAKV